MVQRVSRLRWQRYRPDRGRARLAHSRPLGHCAGGESGCSPGEPRMPVMGRRGVDMVRALSWEPTAESRASLRQKEWLVTNGLGGYASGTVSGTLTRRFHGVLVAALPNPFGRTMML